MSECAMCHERPSIHDLPVCGACGRVIAERFRHEIEADLNQQAAERYKAVSDARDRKRRLAVGMVYYVRIGDHIKIGFTTRLPDRLRELRVDPDALLAAEPGDRETERTRHEQFAIERLGRREDFRHSPMLDAHIEEVRTQHGLPRWALLPNTSRVDTRRSA